MVEGVGEHGFCFFQFELWIWARFTCELFFDLVDVVIVDVAVSSCPDEFSYFKVCLLCEHVCQ